MIAKRSPRLRADELYIFALADPSSAPAKPTPSCREPLRLRADKPRLLASTSSRPRIGKAYTLALMKLAPPRRQSRVPSRRPVMEIPSLAFLFPVVRVLGRICSGMRFVRAGRLRQFLR